MKKLFIVAMMLVTANVYAGIDQVIARRVGGTQEIKLPQGERLINVAWKNTDLWILTKKDVSIPPTNYEFREILTWGVIEGKVKIKEQ